MVANPHPLSFRYHRPVPRDRTRTRAADREECEEHEEGDLDGLAAAEAPEEAVVVQEERRGQAAGGGEGVRGCAPFGPQFILYSLLKS